MNRTVMRLLLVSALTAAACGTHARSTSNSSQSGQQAPTPSASALSEAHLQPGSDPSVLPDPILIADRNNNRLLEVDPEGRMVWQFPESGDLSPGQSFLKPDDAFFAPDGQHIIATQEDRFAISLINLASRKITWRYGTPGQSGSGPNELWNPDDAMELPKGTIFTADIKNCRLLLIAADGHTPQQVYGQTGSCTHDPPRHFGSPNGAFPMSNGHFLVTEIDGDWVDELDLNGAVEFSTHPPGVQYPSDANEVGAGQYLTVDYSRPGQIVKFDRSGNVLWRFQPTGSDALDHPSLALPLPNGDVLCNDDRNDRVIVVDPRQNRIVWQYGVTGQPGASPGMLSNPDGVDLGPPYSLLVTHASTLPNPPAQ